MDHIVLDVEIQRTIGGPDGIGWNDTHLLGVAVCVMYEFSTDRFRVFGDAPDQLLRLRARVLKADRVSGFNTLNFDLPVIFGVQKGDWITGAFEHHKHLKLISNDILRRIWLGRGLNPDAFSPMTHGNAKLDTIVKNTLASPGKIADGARAPEWYQDGNWGDVVNYCLDDVTLERDLTIFTEKYGYVIDGTKKLTLGPAGV